jgi:hypothetical protein
VPDDLICIYRDVVFAHLNQRQLIMEDVIRPGMKMPMTYSQTMTIYVPDLAKGKQIFEANLNKIRSNCMLREVRHCRLPDKTKLSLFKKYYHPANDFSGGNHCQNAGHAGMLKWLLEKAVR